MRDDGVDQAVAAAPVEVAVAEPEGAQVVRIVREGEVDREEGARGLPRHVGVGIEDDGDLRCEQSTGTEDPAGAHGVLDGYEVRMGAERSLGRELEHARPERGEHPSLTPDRCVLPVEPVEELDHVRVRALVPFDDRAVARADPEQEAARVLRVEIGCRCGELRRGDQPDAHDAARDRDGTGRGEEPSELR